MPKITYTEAPAVCVSVLILDNNKLDRFKKGTSFKTLISSFTKHPLVKL
jgi:hypothetical protein